MEKNKAAKVWRDANTCFSNSNGTENPRLFLRDAILYPRRQHRFPVVRQDIGREESHEDNIFRPDRSVNVHRTGQTDSYRLRRPFPFVLKAPVRR